jgi:hypothetical protein
MRGFAIDLTDLVRRQAANADAPSNPPLPEAEAATLQERFAELNDNSVPLTPAPWSPTSRAWSNAGRNGPVIP